MTLVSHKQSLACHRVYRKSILVTLLSLLLAGVSGCDYAGPRNNTFPRDHKTPQNAPLKTELKLNDVQDLARPASSEEGMSIDPAVSIRGGTLSAKGLNNQTLLFATKLDDPYARLDRLESAVQDFRNDFDSVSPSINRLVAIEKDIQDLVGQLEILLAEEPSSKTRPDDAKQETEDKNEGSTQPTLLNESKITSKPADNAMKADLPKVDRSKPTIHDIRIGDHKDKTRIVIETAKKLTYSHDVDNNEGLFTLFFEEADTEHGAVPRKSWSKLIKSVSESKQNGSTILAFNLSGDTKVTNEGVIGPNKDNAYYRIFIDLAK